MPNQDPAINRRRILDSAAALFAKSGFKGTVTHDISHLAGVNESTLFRHFPDKLTLYLGALDSSLKGVRLADDAVAQIERATNGRAALEETFAVLGEAFERDHLLHRLVQFGMLELPGQVQPVLRRHLYALVEQVSQCLAPWIENGSTNYSARTIVLTFLAAVMNYQLVAEAFQAEMAHPLRTFEWFAEICSTASLRREVATTISSRQVEQQK